MFIPDHIIVCSGLAIIASRRWLLPLIPLTAIMIVMNFIDFDHLFNYNLDDGSANSLTLHTLHIYAGSLIFILSICALIFNHQVKWFLVAILGLSSHLAADAIANIVHYDSYTLVSIGMIQLIIFIYIAKQLIIRGPVNQFIAFVCCFWLLGYLELIVTRYGFDMIPNQSAWFWFYPPSIATLAAILVWVCFNKSTLSTY